ncbi:MAG TPA: hypothetical protein VKT24_03525 [Rhizomicrobium sp.]|nr:hypothetical protein [Rhizomicrobium sp.]
MSDDVQTSFLAPRLVLRLEAQDCVALVAASIAFCVAAFAPQVLNDGDTFFHIAAGTRMLADHALLYRDPFSYTFAGTAWEAHEWLAEVAMALSYQAGGWSLLLVLFAFAAATTAGLLAHHLGRWLEWRAQILVTILALSCMTPSLLARPHLLALPLLEMWTAGLVIARSERRAPSFWLLLVMALWVNIHASFLLGLALAVGLAVEAVASEENRGAALRHWGLFTAGAVATALLNPHGLAGIAFPLHMTAAASLAHVSEWQATDFSQLRPFELVLLALIYLFATRGVKISPWRALIVLGLLHLALLHQRHQMVFALAAPLLLAEPISLALRNAFTPATDETRHLATICSFGAVVCLIAAAWMRLAIPTLRVDSPVAPITALQHVPPELRTKPVLNDYSFGGYLIFSGARPFVDSRVELYGDAFLERYAKIIEPDPAVISSAVAAYDIRWSIFDPHSPVVGVLDRLPHWHRLYADRFAVIHIRDKRHS